jgi:hypothetical protein
VPAPLLAIFSIRRPAVSLARPSGEAAASIQPNLQQALIEQHAHLLRDRTICLCHR